MTRDQELQESICSISLREGEATGNSFIVAYGVEPENVDYKKILHDRHLDSALFVELVEQNAGHLTFKMRVLEKDGSESNFCGNGSRFLAHFFAEKFGENYTFSLLGKEEIPLSKNEKGYSYTCSMPELKSLEPIKEEGHLFYHVVVLGEPHLITFDTLTDEELTKLGEAVNKSPRFPAGISINCVVIHDENHLDNTTYERGVNAITKACGSGSLGAFVVSRALSQVKDEVSVKTKGGVLQIVKTGDRVTSSGSASLSQ